MVLQEMYCIIDLIISLAAFRNHFELTLFYENPDRHHQSDIIHHQDSSLTHIVSSRASHIVRGLATKTTIYA